MKITIESTPVIVETDDGVVARRWEGETESGIPVIALVVGVSPQTHDPAAVARFTAELEVLETVAEVEPNTKAEPPPPLGPCCMCEATEGVRNIVMLDRRGAVPGRGRGCFECGLPADSAYAVLCDACFPKWQEDPTVLVTACRGYPATEGRLEIAELSPEPFKHDEDKHRGRTFDDL